jgi:hypothetical protein
MPNVSAEVDLNADVKGARGYQGRGEQRDLSRAAAIRRLHVAAWLISSSMRHLEARGFQAFATIAKEFAGRVVGAVDFVRRANTTIQVSRI